MLRRLFPFAFPLLLFALAFSLPRPAAPPPAPPVQTDAARIDWLESNANSCCVEPRVDLAIGGRQFVQGEDLRASIDEECEQCAAEESRATAPPFVRVAAVIATQLLPNTAGAQAVNSTAHSTDNPRAVLAGVVFFVVVVAVVGWFVSKRTLDNGVAAPPSTASGPRGRASPSTRAT